MVNTIRFVDMFYFDNNQFRVQPSQRVEWLVYKIRELKQSLKHYVILTVSGFNFHEVLDEIVTVLEMLYQDIYRILCNMGRPDLWPTLDLGWPVTDMM